MRGVPVVISHGSGDMTIGYDRAVDAAQIWAKSNACTSAPKPAGVPGGAAADACGASPLMMCTHTGGHEYDPAFTRTAVEFFKSVR